MMGQNGDLFIHSVPLYPWHKQKIQCEDDGVGPGDNQECGETMIHTFTTQHSAQCGKRNCLENLAGSGGNAYVVKALADERSIQFDISWVNSPFFSAFIPTDWYILFFHKPTPAVQWKWSIIWHFWRGKATVQQWCTVTSMQLFIKLDQFMTTSVYSAHCLRIYIRLSISCRKTLQINLLAWQLYYLFPTLK